MVLPPTRALGGAIAATILSVVVAGCGGQAGSDTDAGVALTGDYLSSQESTFALVPDTVIRMTFEENRLSVSAGCNTMFGQFQLDGSQLRVSPLASTMIGCPDALADQDRRIDEFLTGGPLVSAATAGFVLTGTDDTTMVMLPRDVADPDRPLVGSTWRVESITATEAVVSAPEFGSVTVTFAPDTVQVTTPCATGSANYTVLEDGNLTTSALTLSPLNQTDSLTCSEDSAVIDVQNAMSDLFGGTVEVANNGSTVTLTGNGVGVTLRTG